MDSTLQSLFSEIARSRNELELKQNVIDNVGKYFEAHRWGLLLFDRVTNKNRLPKSIQLALSIEYNPVLRYLVQRHTAIHEGLILPPGVWSKICPRFDHGHVMLGPIVSEGKLVGVVGLTRARGTFAFNEDNLADLNALCLHLSSWFAIARSKQLPALDFSKLTSREMQIANLVAQGLTNAQIGKSLWITENSVKGALKRMFRKLEISSRTELVTKLSSFDKRFYF